MKRLPRLNRDTYAGLVIAVLLALFTRWLAPHHADSPSYAFFGLITLGLAIWGALKNAFSAAKAIAGTTWSILQPIWNTIKSVTKTVATGLAHAGDLFRKVASIGRTLWSKVLRPAITGLYTNMRDFSRNLAKWFRPVVDSIVMARAKLQEWHDAHIKPILDSIDVTRRVLSIFTHYHSHVAQALDDKLSFIEGQIKEPFRLYLEKLNETLDWVNRIVTFDGVMNRSFLLKTIFSYRRDLTNFGLSGLARPLTPAEQAAYDKAHPRIKFEQHVQDMRAFYGGGESWVRVKGSEWASDTLALRDSMR